MLLERVGDTVPVMAVTDPVCEAVEECAAEVAMVLLLLAPPRFPAGKTVTQDDGVLLLLELLLVEVALVPLVARRYFCFTKSTVDRMVALPK